MSSDPIVDRGRSEDPSPGELFVVSAPSGAGKTTIIRSLLRDAGFGDSLYYSVSFTTRPMRPGEVDGRDYHFVDEPTFMRMVEASSFYEWAEVHGQHKGTSAEPVLDHLRRGIDVLVDIDVQGAAQVVRRHPEAQTVFLLPPSRAELERRLRSRGGDDEAQIRRRLEEAALQVRQVEHYRYVMINDQVERVTHALATLIQSRRHRRLRLGPEIAEILADFPLPTP